MGNHASKILEGSFLACLLKHCKDLDPESLKWKKLKFYCTQSWPQYPLGDQEKWPEGGSINYNTILQVDMFCRKEGKWTDVQLYSTFLFPKRPPRMAEQMQAGYSDHGDHMQKSPRLQEPEPEKTSDAQGPPTMSKGTSPTTEIKSPGDPQVIYIPL
jgi:hypothetical protein